MSENRIILNPRYASAAPRRDLPDPVRNGDAVLALLEYRALEFDGRKFRVPPIGYQDGIRIEGLLRQFNALNGDTSDSAVPKYRALCDDIVKVCGPLLLPMGRRTRFWWRLRGKPNPLRNATEPELGAVLNFLAQCRMSGRIRLQPLVPPPART